MKIILMTPSDSEGIFDVFNTITVPDESMPTGFIDRWTSIINASPIQPRVVTNKENIFIGSVWNPETDLFTLAENIPLEAAKPRDSKNAVFLINNIIVGTIGISGSLDRVQFLEAAYSSPVTVISTEDSANVLVGYTWDGTNFYPPLT